MCYINEFMEYGKITVFKHKHEKNIYTTFNLSHDAKVEYIIILNTSLYMSKLALNTIIDCVNDFLKDHSIILMTYGITGIIKYYNKGSTITSFVLNGNVNQIVPFELLMALISKHNNVRILFITNNIFNNHFKKYDDHDIIYNIVNNIRVKATCCNFYTFLIKEPYDENNDVKFLRFGCLAKSFLSSLKYNLCLQLMQYQTFTTSIDNKILKSYDINKNLVSIVKYDLEEFKETILSKNFKIMSVPMNGLSMYLQDLKTNGDLINDSIKKILSFEHNDIYNVNHLIYMICRLTNNKEDKYIMLDYYSIKFLQMDNFIFHSTLSYNLENTLSLIRCYYDSKLVRVYNSVYDINCNYVNDDRSEKNIALLPLYLNTRHYKAIKLFKYIPDKKMLMNIHFDILCSKIIDNNIILNNTYLVEYTKFLQYYLQSYLETNIGKTTHFKILSIIFRLYIKKYLHNNSNELHELFIQEIEASILPFHDKTITKAIFSTIDGTIVRNFSLLVQNWNNVSYKQRYLEYSQFKKIIIKSLKIRDNISDVFIKYYNNIYKMMIVHNYCLGNLYTDNVLELLKLYGLQSDIEIIEYMLCDNLNYIKNKYISHIAMYWVVYFMKLYDITTEESSFSNKSLKEIKYMMLGQD